MLIFEMEEKNNRLYTVNEITGNWYNTIGGKGARYRYREPLLEEAAFTALAPAGRGRP